MRRCSSSTSSKASTTLFGDPRNNPSAETNVARLLAAWRAAGRTVLHVRHDSTSPGSPLRPGQPGNDFKPEATPADGEAVHPKSVNSAFIGSGLEDDLRRRGAGSLVIVGPTTNHCVSTTARMAGNLGFDAVVVLDATATFDGPGLDGRVRPAAEVHASALSDLHGELATVADTGAVLSALGGEGSAGG